MSMGGGGSRDKIQSDINVTPLVDVCLVLLIIFMVVTPLLQNGISVQLPVTTNPDKKPEGDKQKVITVGYSTPRAITSAATTRWRRPSSRSRSRSSIRALRRPTSSSRPTSG